MASNQNSQVGPWPDPPIPDLDADGFMRPPWEKFPNLPRGSSGWRMGIGEQYIESFSNWWSRQARPTRLALRAKYPEPSNWSGYWLSISGARA